MSPQERTDSMTALQRQRFLTHYRRHPEQVALYCILLYTYVDMDQEAEAAALLPHGLRAVLQLRQQAQQHGHPPPLPAEQHAPGDDNHTDDVPRQCGLPA